MGVSYLDKRYRFNGVVSTDKTIVQNLEALASAAGCWLTYDVGQGQWGIIINNPRDSVASFDDTNIIGSITISGTGIVDLYNAVHVEFPHIDLSDQRDYVRYEIPIEDRNANEPDNTLQIQYDILNDPVQAGLLGAIELKQSRIDKVVKFITDYSSLGLKAGQIIDITSNIYGFVNKKFRIITLVENDADDGSITLEITASEYDPNVYNDADLIRYIRTTSTGIPTIGNLGIPGTPTVSNFQSGARPHFVVNSTAPTGTVEGLEFWYTTDVPPAVTVDSNRTYQLLDTVRPVSGNTFAFGDTVSLDWDRFNTQNFLVKTRAVNSATTGPYSDPSGTIYYAPEQITNTIDQNTVAKNSTSGLATALGLLTLVNSLDGLFSGNTATGGLFNKIFDLHKTTTGANLLSSNTFVPSVNSISISDRMSDNGFSINDLGSGNFELDYAPTSAFIEADSAVITWTFSDGSDLDIRARVITPNIGMTDANGTSTSLGWTTYTTNNQGDVIETTWPASGTPILTWGGDNQGTGTESIYINFSEFKSQYPSANDFVLECYGNWYGTPGTNSVKLDGKLYNGGTINQVEYNFDNTGYEETKNVVGLGVVVPGPSNQSSAYKGSLVGYFKYNFDSKIAWFSRSL